MSQAKTLREFTGYPQQDQMDEGAPPKREDMPDVATTTAEQKEKGRKPKTMRGLPDNIKMREGREAWEKDRSPVYLMLNLKTKCSYGCVKCALRGPGRRKMGSPLSLEERQRTIDVASQAGAKELVIIGMGEPTEDFENVIKPTLEAAYDRGMGTIMFSTVSHLTREQAEFYRDHDVSIIVSLDSLNPETYQFLTRSRRSGVVLEDVLKNLKMLRDVYAGTEQDAEGKKVVRLGINTTVSKQNVGELEDIKKFAGEDMMYFANPPMPQGSAGDDDIWELLVGDQFSALQEKARGVSETGGHSSVTDGACGYFNRGISVDVDGEVLTCGYASETAHLIGNVRDNMTVDDLLRYYNAVRSGFEEFRKETGDTATCPIRSERYEREFLRFVEKHGKAAQPSGDEAPIHPRKGKPFKIMS